MPGTTVEKLASEGRADSTTFTGLAGPSLLAVCETIRENMGNITEDYIDGAGKKTVFSIHGLCFCYFKVARRLAVHHHRQRRYSGEEKFSDSFGDGGRR